MSVVLALGLSPIGQAPAYAAKQSGQAPAEQVLQTQALAFNFADTMYYTTGSGANLKINPTLAYAGPSGTPIALHISDSSGSEIDNSASSGDRFYSLEVYKLTKDAEGKVTKETKLPDTLVTMDDPTGVYTATVVDAGDYSVKVTGGAKKGQSGVQGDSTQYQYAGKGATYYFSVGKLNIGDKDDEGAYKTAFAVTPESPLTYTGADQAISVTSAGLVEGVDFKVDTTSVKERTTHTVTVTGTGDNCTGSQEVEIVVNQTSIYALDSSNNPYAEVTDVPLASTAATSSSPLAVNVPPNKVTSPVEITFNGEKLTDGSDYKVQYYSHADGGSFSDANKIAAKDIPTEIADTPSDNTYYALVTLQAGNRNFLTNTDANKLIYLALTPNKAGTIEKIADSATLASQKYTGQAVEPVVKDGGTFLKGADDVTSLIGTNFKVLANGLDGGATYGILSTNTAKTAYIDNNGKPVGAGEYYLKVTGAGNYNSMAAGTEGAGVMSTFTIAPLAATEGDDAGQLIVEMPDEAYDGGNYVTMHPKVSVHLKKGDDGSEILRKVDGVEDPVSSGHVEVTNYKVTYYNSDGVKVTAPSDKGTYKAVFEFSGNLAGTKAIEKEFKVETGKIETRVKGLMMYKPGVDHATGSVAPDADDLQDLTLVYTGDARDIDKSQVVFLEDDDEDDATAPVPMKASDQAKILEGADFEFSYASRGATVDAASGKPLAYGTYGATATFSGNYTGTVAADLLVDALDLSDVTTTARNAEVQYLQEDGSYDADYTAVYTGKAIEPTIRIAVKDGKQRTSEPTLVNAAVYAASFKDNTAQGAAQIKLAANAAYRNNVSTASGFQANAFAIAGSSLKDMGAAVEFDKGKSTFDYNFGNAVAGIKLSVAHNGGKLAYADTETGAKVKGTALVGPSGSRVSTTVYFDGTNYYTLDDVVYTEIVEPVRWVPASPVTATAYIGTNGDASATVIKGTATVSSTETANQYYDAAAGKFYSNLGTSGRTSAIEITATKFIGDLPDGATGYVAGKANATIDATTGDTDVYKNGSKYYTAGPANYVQIESSNIDANSFVASGYDYSLKVLDADGATVGATFTPAADGSTVTVGGVTKAGEYTVVVGGGYNGLYGGRVTGTFTVAPLSFEKAGAFGFTYTPGVKTALGTKADEPLSFGEDWDVDYNADKAKTKDGITLEANGGTLVVQPATSATPLEKGTEYEVAYENNKAAGQAKITISGKGNYAGSVEKTFKINKGKIEQGAVDEDGVCTEPGYVVQFDEDAFVKNAEGDDVIVFSGKENKPAFEINFFKQVGDEDPTSYLAADEYEFDYYNNVNVTYWPNTPIVDKKAMVVIKASGNYEGTIYGYFQIDPIDLSKADNVTVEVADQAYTGTAVNPTAKITYNGVELKEGTDYNIAGDGSAEVGEHKATITDVFGGNYQISEGAIYKTYQIKNVDLTGATVQLSAASFKYNGKAQAPKVQTVTLKDGTVLAGDTLNVTVPASKNVGTYAVTVSGKAAGVTGSAKASYRITKAANTLKVAKAKRTVKAAKLKKAAQKVTGLKVSKKGQGTMVYKVTKVTKGKKTVAKKNFKVAKSSVNKLTVKKGLAKGTYKVTMTAKAKGNANYNASKVLKKVVTVVVK